jgi:dinuclear metal center YbgI/SA1388 family protein
MARSIESVHMSVTIEALISCANQLLKPEVFNDYCPNGLQVQGKSEIKRLVVGVTASQALIDAAIEQGADAILVHHGFFWKAEDPCIVGIKHRRLQALIKNDINLIAYHLPLDAHPQYGNNAALARLLGVVSMAGLEAGNPYSVGNIGRLPEPLSATQLCRAVAAVVGREPLLVKGGDHLIETLAWCSGAAQNYIDVAAARGADAYLSGEISESTVHSARELGVHYIAAGHHATERYGVQALGQWLAEQFDLEYQFIEIDCPA